MTTTRHAALLAWSLCAAALALLALSLVLILLGWSTPLPKGWTPWENQAILVAGVAGAPILGGLIASRRPENPYGWLWCAYGMSIALLPLAFSYAAYASVVEPGSLPAPRAVVQLLGTGWVSMVILMPFLFLLFPDGRLPSRRWRFVAWTVVVVGTMLLILGSFTRGETGFAPFQNPFGIEGTIGRVITLLVNSGVFVIFAAIVLSAFSLVFRFRRAAGMERQQLKWLALAAAVLGVDLVFQGFIGVELPGVWDALDEAIIFAGLYVAIGIAVLRYQLYDIDVIINRALVYGALTVSLALVYMGGVAGVQAVFRLLTGQERQSQLAVVASTLAIAALFVPLRRRVQALIDRRFYRDKYDARQTLEEFGAKLRDETDLEDLSRELALVVHDTVRPTYVSLWLRPSGRGGG